ncbi:MAG: helix-turn-helix transcriptional regulator [Acidobacteriota bacterium]
MQAAVDLVKLHGLPADGLFDGLPFDGESLSRVKRVAWDDYCVIVERIAERAPDGLEDLLEAGYHQVFPELRAIAGAVIGPKQFYWFVTEVGNPLMWPPVAHRFEDLIGSRVRISAHLRDGARPCEALFRGSTGGWRGLSRLLGLPSATVVAADLAGDHGIWEIELPPSHTLASRAKRAMSLALRVVLGREHDGSEVAATIEDHADERDPRLAQAIGMWKLTPRQTEVLRHLVRGDSDDAIAAALGCSPATVEQQLSQLMRRIGVASRAQLLAAFWSE